LRNEDGEEFACEVAFCRSKHLPRWSVPVVFTGFVGRVPGIELSHDKAVVLENLDKIHRQAREILGLDNRKFITARQVHGNKIAVVDSPADSDHCFEDCDGLITNQRGVCLGVYVADCCAVIWS
jgi:copper oxidase (laccase) domain-containing protein